MSNGPTQADIDALQAEIDSLKTAIKQVNDNLIADLDTEKQTRTNQISDLANVVAVTPPPGAVVAFAGNTAPAGWHICDGTLFNRNDFPKLFAAIGLSYGSTDASNFKVPDYQGLFLRGLANGSGNEDPAFQNRLIGSIQPAGTRLPVVQFTISSDQGGHGHGGIVGDRNGSHDNGSDNPCPDGHGGISGNGAHGHTINGGGDAETRPRNIAVNWIIKLDHPV